jgi:hypothetical protein
MFHARYFSNLFNEIMHLSTTAQLLPRVRLHRSGGCVRRWTYGGQHTYGIHPEGLYEERWTMDEVLLRAIERLLAVIIGGLCVYLEYLLFLCIPAQKEGEGKIEFPGGASIFITRVGSGLFFAMVGAAIVGLSLYEGIDSSRRGDAGAPIVYQGIVANAPPPMMEPIRERNSNCAHTSSS